MGMSYIVYQKRRIWIREWARAEGERDAVHGERDGCNRGERCTPGQGRDRRP